GWPGGCGRNCARPAPAPCCRRDRLSDKISVTVASVIEHDGRFLLVEEETDNGVRFNQPAGHLEPDESIVAGAVRETLEETAYHFVPTALVGIYRWRYP